MSRADRSYSDKLRSRILLVAAGFALLFCALVARAFHLQVLQHDAHQRYAESIQTYKRDLTYRRGPIVDRNGEELAVSLDAESVFVDPKMVTDAERTASVLARELEVPVQTVRDALAKDRRFVWIRRLVSDDAAARIRAADLPGVGFVTESRRHYPNGHLAAHILGFVGDDCQGLEGLELTFDGLLKGSAGYVVGEKDARGRPFFPDGVLYQNSLAGGSLELTIDAKIQHFAEQALDEVVSRSNPKGATAIVMHSETGAILAMASRPTFDPNRATDFSAEARRNRAVSFTAEPGSTFKSILLPLALESGMTPASEFFCENGAWRFGGATIHDTHHYQTLTLEQIIKVSSNIGASKVAAAIGPERLHAHIRNIGFGEKTRVGLPGEMYGLVRPTKDWSRVCLATHAFGQGISVTPIQLLTGFNAVVDGGFLVQPRVVKREIEPTGEIHEIGPVYVRRVIRPETSRAAARILATVTERGGTGTLAAVPHFRVAGKTGTAQKVYPGAKEYHPTARVASFVGCVPAEDPLLTILVMVDEPQGKPYERYGGYAAAPAFREIAIRTLSYLGVFPEETLRTAAAEAVADVPLNEESVSAPQAPSAPAPEWLALMTMPDVRGMSMRAVLRMAQERDLMLTVEGTGVAVRQEPAPGAPLGDDKRASVVFAPPS